MVIFPDAQEQLALQSQVGSHQNWNSSSFFLIISKNEEDLIKNEDARVVTTIT